ncbi:hypothetical protein [Niveibacterium sp.]|uniref:hypothetical protein n=1 Tax=Niveibacterium sp. TaxID=2017444 RepID=UPI0035B11F9D
MSRHLSWLFVSLCLLASMPLSVARDVLEEPVSLRAEADLIKAVALTLQHAITTSEQFQGRSPALRKFADKEVKKKPFAPAAIGETYSRANPAGTSAGHCTG